MNQRAVTWYIALYKDFVSLSSFICAYQPKDTADKDKLLSLLRDQRRVLYMFTSLNSAGKITQHYIVE